MSILSDRTDKARFAEDTFLFLFSVALVAVATIVLFSIASISQLDNSKATLKGSPIDNSLLDDKVIGTVLSYPESNASPVSRQTKSSSSSDADNMSSATPVPPTPGMGSEGIVAEPALMPTPDRKATATAIETSHDSTQGPSTVEPAPPQPSAPQEASAQPASIADAASATAIETSHDPTQGPSTAKPAPPQPSAPQEASAQPASIADAASVAQHATGVTVRTRAISDQQRDQMFRDFEIRGNGHTNLDHDSAGERVFGATSGRGSAPLPHAASHRRNAGEADHKTTEKLNRLELSRLLKGSRASPR